MTTRFLLLAGTALLALAAASPQAHAAATDGGLILAQAPPPPADKEDKDKKPGEKKPPAAQPKQAPKPPQQPATPSPPPAQKQAPAAQPSAPPPAAPTQAAPPPPPAPAAPKPPQPPAAQQAPRPQVAPPPAAQQRQEQREERREQRREERRDQHPPSQTPPPAAQQPASPPPTQPAPAAKPQQQAPAAAPSPQQQQPAPARPTFRSAPTAPSVQPPPPPATQVQPNGKPPAAAPQQQASTAAPQPQPQPAPGTQPSQTFRAAPQPAPGVQPPPQPRDAREFIRRNNQAPTRTIEQVRRERQQTQQGGTTFIREGDRVIVQQEGRTFIRHSEASRFAVGARDVRVDRRGDETFTMVQRPNNITIINITDPDGRLIRRVRRDARGREIVIIDNSFAGLRHDTYFIDLPPPQIRIPRRRYIVDAWDARPDDIFSVFFAAPVERLERRYTLDEVRYSEPLRARMPRVDVDVNFESGSWQLWPEQVDKLGVIADGLNRAISRNPREVFMIEGHTDAVGNPEDNLSLSDRRAEAVAVALTEQFQVPAENLVTQGYGEQYLKDPTDGPSRVNRRVAVRRITPLIDQQARR